MKRAKSEGVPEKALALMRMHPEGVPQNLLETELQMSGEDMLQMTNQLLSQNLIDVLSGGSGKELIFKLKDLDQAMKLKGLTAEDMLVYQAIQSGKNQGIWSRDIKRRTNLAQTAVTKILKTLETRNLVKPVKSVNDGKRKIYVLFELEPAADITGGLWFQGQDMDVEFIQTLQQQCKRFISERGTATVEQLQQFIKNSRIFNVPVAADQLSLILTTLCYDGVLEPAAGDEEETWRIAGHKVPDDTAFTSFPCGICPVIDDCTPGGVISPEKCVYFDQYLQF